MPKLTLTFLLVAVTLSAQLTPNSVTVTASRNSSPQPDQVIFSVTVAAGVDETRDYVIAAVQATGITLANFSGIGYSGQLPGTGEASLVQWGFTLPVPLSNMKSTVGLLTAVQQSLARDGRLALSFSVQGMQVSDRLQQSQSCVISDLIADARAQAQKLASGAGMSLGSILAMSMVAPTMSVSTFLSSGGASTTGAYALPFCSVSVKFALGGF